MTSRSDTLLETYRIEAKDALYSLTFSWDKLKNASLPPLASTAYDEFEPWEALTARFARVTDIFVSKYLRLLVLDQDPAFRGETRDLLDTSEKLGFISDADRWMKIRELRNKIAHEYTKQDLVSIFSLVLSFIPFVMSEMKEFRS